MPRLLTGIAVLAAFVLLGASSTMNYMFASSLGRTPIEGIVLGVVVVGVDVLKAAVAVVLAVAARERRWVFFCIGGFAFMLFSALSLTASFGFSASNRSAVFGERERQNSKLAAIEIRMGELRAKLKTLSTYRPLPVVDEAIAVARVQQGWFGSKQCTIATKSTREFCDGLGKLRTERAAALEGNRLEDLLTAKEAEAEQLRGAGTGLASDPQAKALANSIGLDEGQVQRGLMALLAVVIEVASGLGVYLALGDRLGTKRETEPTEKETPLPAQDVAIASAPSAPEPIMPTQVLSKEAPSIDEPRPGVMVGIRSPPRTARRNGGKLGSGTLTTEPKHNHGGRDETNEG